jgi:hypothetical protein
MLREILRKIVIIPVFAPNRTYLTNTLREHPYAVVLFFIIIFCKWRINCSLLLDRGARNWLTWCILVITSQSSKLVYLMQFLVQAARKVVTHLPPLTCSLSPGEALLNQGHHSVGFWRQPLSDMISPLSVSHVSDSSPVRMQLLPSTTSLTICGVFKLCILCVVWTLFRGNRVMLQ